jgi:hypothetical protein
MKLSFVHKARRSAVAILFLVFIAVALVACSDALRIEPPGAGAGPATGAGATGGGTTTSTGGAGGSSTIPCWSNSDCPEPTNVCDTVKSICVECLNQDDCTHQPGTVCDAGVCDCPGIDSFCPPNLCVDLQTSSVHCGSCGHACFGSCLEGVCADPWEPTATEDAPQARSRHLAVWTGSEMVVWGGTSNGAASGALSSGGIYNRATSEWRAVSLVNAPEARIDATVVWTGSTMIVWGGRNKVGTALADGGVLDPTTNTWTAVPDDSLSGRYRHTAVWTGSEMIIWGGRDQAGTQISSGARFDPEKKSWLATSIVSSPSGRERHTAVWDDANKQMLVWGGFGDGANTTNIPIPGDGLVGGRVYALGSNSWGLIEDVGEPSSRYSHTAVFDGVRMVLYGGDDNNVRLNDGFSLTSNTWSPFSGDGPGARSLHTAVWLDAAGVMVVWGGEQAASQLVKTGGVFDSSSNAWQKVTPTALEARIEHTAVSTGKSMIVWGGRNQNGNRLNTGGIYTP